MSMHLHHTTVLPDELKVRLNPVGKFAVIELGPQACDTDLHVNTPAEADALIKAACEAKLLLEQAAGPSPRNGILKEEAR